MQIKQLIFRSLIFIVINLLLIWFHIWIFRCPLPHVVWLTIVAHICGLIFFPYKQVFINLTENENEK